MYTITYFAIGSNNSPRGIISLGAFPYIDINLSYRIGPGLIGNRNLPYRPQVYGGHSSKIYPLIRPDRYIGDGAGAVAESFETYSGLKKKKKKKDLKISKIVSSNLYRRPWEIKRWERCEMAISRRCRRRHLQIKSRILLSRSTYNHISSPFAFSLNPECNYRLITSRFASEPKIQNPFLETSARGVSHINSILLTKFLTEPK